MFLLTTKSSRATYIGEKIYPRKIKTKQISGKILLLLGGITVFFAGSLTLSASDKVYNSFFPESVEIAKRDYLPEDGDFAFESKIAAAKSLPAAEAGLYKNYLKGLYFANEGDYESAIKQMRRVKKIDPGSIYVRLKIATYLMNIGKLEEAERELKYAQKADPDSIDVSLALIFLYSYVQKQQELQQEYEKFLEKAHKLKPENLKISEYLAQFYFYAKRIPEAIEVYQAILKANPDYIEGFFWLGYLYEENGEHKEAVKCWEQGLVIDPASAPILNSLGYVYAEAGVNLDKAELMIKKALEQEPENGAYIDSLAWVYFKQQKYTEAEKYLLQAVEFLKDPVIYEHLGDIYVTLGDRVKAVLYYEEGLKYFPDYQKLKEKLEEHGQDKIPEKQSN